MVYNDTVQQRPVRRRGARTKCSTRTTSHVGNLNDACHEAERRSDGRPSTGDDVDVDGNDVKEGKGGSPMRMCVAQGKSHVPSSVYFLEGSQDPRSVLEQITPTLHTTPSGS